MMTPLFRDLTLPEKVKLFKAWLNGHIIQFYNSNVKHWVDVANPVWSPSAQYRVKLSTLAFDFTNIAPKWIALARDNNKKWHLFQEIPTFASGKWTTSSLALWLRPPEAFALDLHSGVNSPSTLILRDL